VSQSNSQEWITLRPHDTPGGISDGQNSPTASKVDMKSGKYGGMM
jgi:hypothetical protein